MSLVNSSLSALGRLAALIVILAAFVFGLAGVVYMSLQGSEVKVPEITGKDFGDGEKELAALGLKIKKRADRASEEKANTVIEQLPKPGETVKTGQMILVVTSKGPGEGDERPASLKSTTDEDDTEKIEEMITDKPKKPKSNSNTNRKKADTGRDVNDNSSNSNSNSNSSSEGNSNKKDTDTEPKADKDKSGKSAPAANKPAVAPARPVDSKPKSTPRP